ncbi:hypothetical protein ACWEPN_11715 [Nonomuraea wenchangensis]
MIRELGAPAEQGGRPCTVLVRAGSARAAAAGAHAPEAAERAGHGVDVLLKVYAKCIDGQREVANGRILEALSQ